MIRNAFYGEISPSAVLRADFDKFHQACSSLVNFDIDQMGGLRRRRGLKHMADAKSGSRIIPFVYNSGDTAIIELSNTHVRVFKNGSLANTTATSLFSGWSQAALRRIRYQQINDVVYLASPDMPPCMLTRYADNDWRLEKITWDAVPEETNLYREQEMHVNGTSLTWPGAESMTAGDIVRVARRIPSSTYIMPVPGDARDRTPLDKYIAARATIQYDDGNDYIHYFTCVNNWQPSLKGESNNPGDYPYYFRAGIFITGLTLVCHCPWSVTTSGTWSARVDVVRKLQEGNDGIWDSFNWSWESLRTMESTAGNERNFSLSGDEPDLCRIGLVLVWMHWKAPLNIGNPQLDVNGFDMKQYFRVDSVSGATAQCTILNDVNVRGDFSTRDWSLQAFGSGNGYPRAIGFHQDRLWFGGTAKQPQTVWASAVGDYYNFDADEDGADASLRFTMAASGQNMICWISPQRGLAVGTTDAEWTLTGDKGIIDAEGSFFSVQSHVGSAADVDAAGIENGLVYVQRDKRHVRQYAYSLEADGYMAEDLTLLADHILQAGVVEVAYQRSPYPVLWCLLADGTCACLTYNMLQQVKAWGRVDTAGSIKSIAVLPRADGLADEIWMLVDRGTWCLEAIKPDSPYTDGQNNLDYISEMVTNDLEFVQSMGAKKQDSKLMAYVRRDGDNVVTVSNDGVDWYSPGIEPSEMNGWTAFWGMPSWDYSHRAGIRVSGNGKFELYGIKL